MSTAKEMQRKVGLVAAIALCGVIAAIAIIATHTGVPTELSAKSQHAHKMHRTLGLKHQDMSLLQSALEDQNKERHAACLAEATTAKARTACHVIAAAQHKAAHARVAAHKAGMGLKGADLKLLHDAQRGQHKEEVSHCEKCVTKECKANCAATLASAEKASKKVAARKVSLGLKQSDLALLASARKSQDKETAKGEYMHEMDQAAMKHAMRSMDSSSGVDDINHVPGDDGDGDWAPGMRANAMAQLKAEEKEAQQTAKEAAETDSDDSWSH